MSPPSPAPGTEALLATLTAARKRIDHIAHQYLPFDRAIALELERRAGLGIEHDLLDLVGGILDREVDIWRRSFAARLANHAPRPDTAPEPTFAPPPRPPHIEPTPPPRPPEPPTRSYRLNPIDPDQDITLTDADRVRAILDAGDEPSLILTPPPPSPAIQTFDDEIERLVLEELERARDELSRSTQSALPPSEHSPPPEEDDLELELEPDDLDLIEEEDEPAGDREAPASLPPLSLDDDLISFAEDEDLEEIEEEEEDHPAAVAPLNMGDLPDEDDLVSFADPSGDEDDEDAEGVVAGSLMNHHLLDGDDLVSFEEGGVASAAERAPEPTPATLLEPAAAVLAAASRDPIFDDLLEEGGPEPEEEATIMVPPPVLSSPRVVSSPNMVRFSSAPNLDETDDDEEEDRSGGMGALGGSSPAVVASTKPTPTAVSWSRQGLSERLGSELEEDAPRAAAVQLLGAGQARTLGHTLELESAEDLSADDGDDDSDEAAGGGGGSMSVTLEEEYEEERAIPRLTEDTGSAPVRAPQPSAVQAPGAADIARALKKAHDTEQSGDMQQAILLYGDVIDLDPQNAEARMGRGRCLMELSDYAAAMSDFQKAEDLKPDSPGPSYEMGNLFYNRKDYRRAITFYTQSLGLDPKQAMARVRRGMSHHYRREHDEALDDLLQAQRIDPDIPGLSGLIKKIHTTPRSRR